MSWKDLQFTGWFGSDFSWMYWSDPNRGANVDVLRNKSGVLYDCDCHKCEQTMCWHVLFRWRSLTSQSRLYLQNLVHRHLAALAIRTIERAIFWSQSFKWLVFLLPLCYRNLRLRNGLKYATGANATAGFVHACFLFFVLMSIWCFELCSVSWVYVGARFGLTCIFSPFTNILDLFLGNCQNG